MESGKVFLDQIRVGYRLRGLDESKVKSLADSMNAIGLIQPIVVWQEDDSTALLVAGHHRLAAAKSLGWDSIDCFFTVADDIDRELVEIDENLMRAELTPAQTAEHLSRRKELWTIKSGNSVPTLGGRGNGGFASDVSAKVGLGKRAVNEAISRAEALGDDIAEVAGTSLDKGVELDALAKMHPDQRKDLIARAKAGEKVSARRPVPVTSADDALNDFEATQKQVNALVSAWNKAGPEARAQFREYIDGPVFDSTSAGRG